MSQPSYGPPTGEPQDPYAGQQPPQDQPYQQPYGAQPPYPGQQPYPGQPYPGQAPYPGQQPYPGQAPYGYAPYAPADPYQKSKLAAGLLGIFLGAWGVHRFYLGYTGIGIAQIVVTIFTLGLGGLWGFIEGIVYLAATKGSFTVDAQGRPLRA